MLKIDPNIYDYYKNDEETYLITLKTGLDIKDHIPNYKINDVSKITKDSKGNYIVARVGVELVEDPDQTLIFENSYIDPKWIYKKYTNLSSNINIKNSVLELIHGTNADFFLDVGYIDHINSHIIVDFSYQTYPSVNGRIDFALQGLIVNDSVIRSNLGIPRYTDMMDLKRVLIRIEKTKNEEKTIIVENPNSCDVVFDTLEVYNNSSVPIILKTKGYNDMSLKNTNIFIDASLKKVEFQNGIKLIKTDLILKGEEVSVNDLLECRRSAEQIGNTKITLENANILGCEVSPRGNGSFEVYISNVNAEMLYPKILLRSEQKENRKVVLENWIHTKGNESDRFLQLSIKNENLSELSASNIVSKANNAFYKIELKDSNMDSIIIQTRDDSNGVFKIAQTNTDISSAVFYVEPKIKNSEILIENIQNRSKLTHFELCSKDSLHIRNLKVLNGDISLYSNLAHNIKVSNSIVGSSYLENIKMISQGRSHIDVSISDIAGVSGVEFLGKCEISNTKLMQTSKIENSEINGLTILKSSDIIDTSFKNTIKEGDSVIEDVYLEDCNINNVLNMKNNKIESSKISNIKKVENLIGINLYAEYNQLQEVFLPLDFKKGKSLDVNVEKAKNISDNELDF